MQMIADGKISKEIKFNVLNKRDMLYTVNATIDDVTMRELLDLDFEILEDKTEEIEEFEVDDNYYIHTELGNFKGTRIDIAFVNKFNELTKIVNKLNKQDTSKETNCMTDLGGKNGSRY